jgi:hypothetical protein
MVQTEASDAVSVSRTNFARVGANEATVASPAPVPCATSVHV